MSTGSATHRLPKAARLAGYIVSFAVAAGFSKALWLLVFGVNEQRWKEQAGAALSNDHLLTERHTQI